MCTVITVDCQLLSSNDVSCFCCPTGGTDSIRTQASKDATLTINAVDEAKILVLLMDQGPIGMGMSSFIHFCGVNLIHISFDPFHRVIRDMKLDVAGVGPKALRQKLHQCQLSSSYLWTLNYRPYGSGGFAQAKTELLEHFLASEFED